MVTIQSFADYQTQYAHSVANPEAFWAEIAETFYWRKKWDKVLEWNFDEPKIEWFIGGKLNITENCLDRHLQTLGNKTAIIWESNNPDEPTISLTYKELHEKVCHFANVLQNFNVQKGDRVIIYLPMIPEGVVAMLACARIGAVHSVVFAGFSANSLTDRINDCGAKLVITADGGFRGEKIIPLKETVDEALEKCPSVKNVLVFRRTRKHVYMQWGRDVFWDKATENISTENTATEMDSEDMLFILYTSGSTGKPKGVVHTTAGYMVYTQYSFENVFQIRQAPQPPKGEFDVSSSTPSPLGRAGVGLDVFWCTADIGWVTGHSYIVYAPLLAGATVLLYEGIPTYPHKGRFWEIIDKHKVTHFYTAPTAIRSLMALGTEAIEKHSLASLKVLGSVGEPINEEAWHWYDTNIGKGKCPIVDTWWQTETGGILISPLAGITPTKPTFATLPLCGVQPIIVDEKGNELKGNNVEGNLCIKFPFPSMLRTTYGDHERCRQTYFSTFKGLYFTGDGAKRDADGYYRILGRVDDVINVSGHRLGTAEVENAINEHPAVVESAVVGYPHEIKGQGVFAFVVINPNPSPLTPEGRIAPPLPSPKGREFDIISSTPPSGVGGLSASGFLSSEILATVTKIIGAIAKPDKILFVSGLPKTRSGKIMRRILRKIAEGDASNLGDIATLLNPEIVEEIKQKAGL